MGDLIRRENNNTGINVQFPEIKNLRLPTLEDALNPPSNPTNNPRLSGNSLDLFFGREKLTEYTEKYPLTPARNLQIWQNEIENLPK